VLMRAGRVLAAGPLAALQSDPALPLATARDAAVGLDAVVTAVDAAYGLATLAVAGGTFIVPAGAGTAIGERRRLRIAAGDVSLAREPPGPSTILNVLETRILTAQTGGDEVTAVLGLGRDGAGARILARVTRRSFERLGLAEGMAVYAQIKSVALAPGAR